MRSSTLQHLQESRNNYLSIFSYVAINFNHSPTPHFHSPQSSQSKSWLTRIDKQLIRWRHGAAEAGKVIKGLQLLRAKRFQVNVARDFPFCHSEDVGHTVVAVRTSGARWAGKRHCWLGKATEGWTRIDGWTRLRNKMSLIKTGIQKQWRNAQPLVKLVLSSRHHQTSWTFLAGGLRSGVLMANAFYRHRKFLFLTQQKLSDLFHHPHCEDVLVQGRAGERFILMLMLSWPRMHHVELGTNSVHLWC